VPDPDLAAIIQRLRERLDAIGDLMVERYRAEIVDYATADHALLEDVRTVSLDNARSLLANLERGDQMSPEELERSATAAARRVHQGIPLEAFLHAFRLWSQIFWEQVLAEARTDRPGEREAAVRIAGSLMAHADRVSSAGALAYLEEVQGVWSDQEIVRRDLLELLLAGDDPEAARRHAASLGTDLAADYAVVVIRAADRVAHETTPATLRDRDLLRSTLDAARTWLTRPARPALVGLRHGEVVALCPAADHEEHADIRGRCEALAQADLQTHIAVGLGGHADRLLGELLRPVLAYDAERGTDLVQTLRTYVQAGFSPTRSAAQLIVHPNTVLYRLRRIRELTGRDPHEPDDLVLLAIALKHLDGH
jgi:hypothetical protein